MEHGHERQRDDKRHWLGELRVPPAHRGTQLLGLQCRAGRTQRQINRAARHKVQHAAQHQDRACVSRQVVVDEQLAMHQEEGQVVTSPRIDEKARGV